MIKRIIGLFIQIRLESISTSQPAAKKAITSFALTIASDPVTGKHKGARNKMRLALCVESLFLDAIPSHRIITGLLYDCKHLSQ